MSDSVRPHRQQPTRLPCPCDSPGKNTGVGCHFLLQCVKVKGESEVAQSCPTLRDPWTAAYQAPPSMGFSRQEYCSGMALPSPLWWPMKCQAFAMAAHSSTLAWKIPWTEEPCRLQSMELLRVRHTERLHFHFLLSCIGEGNGTPLQCSCLENPRDRGAWWAAVYGVAQSQTRLK